MAEMILTLKTQTLRRSDGLVAGLRVTSANVPGLVNAWFLLNRETDRLERLDPYRFGMQLGRRGQRTG